MEPAEGLRPTRCKLPESLGICPCACVPEGWVCGSLYWPAEVIAAGLGGRPVRFCTFLLASARMPLTVRLPRIPGVWKALEEAVWLHLLNGLVSRTLRFGKSRRCLFWSQAVSPPTQLNQSPILAQTPAGMGIPHLPTASMSCLSVHSLKSVPRKFGVLASALPFSPWSASSNLIFVPWIPLQTSGIWMDSVPPTCLYPDELCYPAAALTFWVPWPWCLTSPACSPAEGPGDWASSQVVTAMPDFLN